MKSPFVLARLEAFADIILNMFDVMLAELPESSWNEKAKTPSDTWLNFFIDTVTRSSILRGRLERQESGLLYQPKLRERYEYLKLVGRIKVQTGHKPL